MPLYVAKKPTGLKYVGSDTTVSQIKNTTTEGIIGWILVPANTVKTGIIASTSVWSHNSTTSDAQFYYRIRCGTSGSTSDTSYNYSITRNKSDGSQILRDCGYINAYITGPDWTVDNYVMITAEMNVANDNIYAWCMHLIVLGE